MQLTYSIFMLLVVILTISVNSVQAAGSNPRLPPHQQIGLRVKGHGVNRHILPKPGGGHIEL